MSTDSESHSLTDKANRNSATYSICSLDEVPVRKSAVQIIRERSSTDLIQPGSPRRKGTMQITKLVLKDPPTSPKRTKVTPMLIKSIKTFTSSAMIVENGHILNDHSNKPKDHLGPGEEAEYKITPLPQINTGRLKEEFEAKKTERSQANSEFQNYLLESFNKENKPKPIEISKATTVLTSESSANAMQQKGDKKGKSDSSVTTSCSSTQQTASSATNEQKSEQRKDAAMPDKADEHGSTKPPTAKRSTRPKTADSRKSIPEPKKEKSYDPLKAREFIKEQQAKRKQERKASTPQIAEKDLIKKRLEDLKKNTQVLVSKNVQKTRKRSLSASGASSQKSGSAPLKAVENSKASPAKALKKSTSTSSLKPVIPMKSDSVKSSASSRESRRRSSLLKVDMSEHMGIMRKPDGVTLEEVMTSPLKIQTPPRSVNPPEGITPVPPSEPVQPVRNAQEKSIAAIEQELKLNIPEMKLVHDSPVKLYESPAIEKKEFKPVPPWLKHTLLQPDPYPFIMAVRKKLEAIRNLNQNQTMPFAESALPKRKPENVKRAETANSQKCLDFLETLKSVPYIHKPSEVDQNISSVSIQHSDSNTTSEISSIKSDFILPLPPLSSTKFESTQPVSRDTHHPEADPISPLSVDRISNLKITANGSAPERSINFNRGDHMPEADLIPDRISFNNRNVKDLRQSQLSLNTSEKQRNFLQNPVEKSTKELEYQKMLEAFNRSLTQVIEVNQQLYSTLNKPPEPSQPERIKIRDGMTQTTPVASIANASANSNYSEDFERSDELKPSNQPANSTESTPEKKSSSELTTSLSTTPSSASTTAPQSTTSPDDSPAGKTQSSDQSRSLSLSDSHNTNPPMPEEYLPSFEESLRQRPQPPLPEPTEAKHGNSSTSIETQISDEAPDEGKKILRETTIDTESKSLESISMKLSEASEALNDQSPPVKEVEVATLKAASSSGADDSELEAIEMTKGTAMNDITMGSDIMAVFNRTDMEVSIMSTTFSEANLSYSSIGLYDQLIQTEKCKSDQLAAHARLKEKALLNRTKGQLAWLELQKQRYRERGMIEQISIIKKKQRAILMRLEKERADLNRFKKSPTELSSRTSTGRSPITPKSLEKLNSFSSHSSNSIALRRNSTGSCKRDTGLINASLVALEDMSGTGGDGRLHQRRRTVTTATTMTTISNSQMQLTTAVRGMELEPSEGLEDILQRREQELQKRRQHVQTLLEWHQKLDREEQEILDIERNLLKYNQRKIAESREADQQTLNRIRSIEKSLHTLQQIPDRQSSKSSEDDSEEVRALGSKLNRLWYRLTGVKENRYEPGRSYTFTKANLEVLYEQAKQRVLEGFKDNNGMRKVLFEHSMSGLNSSGSVAQDVSGFSEQRNTSSERVHTTVESCEGNSFQTTVNSADLPQEDAVSSAKLDEEEESKNDEQNGERSGLLDVEEIISRVSDITDNINGLLSSTTNIDELMLQEEQQNQQSDSVEFHTIEEEQDSGSRTKPSSDTCSGTFDIATVEEYRLPQSVEDSQSLIEDISLPPMMNDDSLLNDESIVESIAESVEKTTEEIADDASLEEEISTASSATTPTTAEETETEYNDVLIEKSPTKDSNASELEKRLITLNENLGELNESIERVSAIRSPEVPKAERQNSSESECVTPPVMEDEYSTDMDFTVEDRKSSTESVESKPFLDDIQAIKEPQKLLPEGIIDSHKIEIKIRNINANENFPHPAAVGVPSTSGASNFSYLTPPAHGPSPTAQTTVIQNRMPDIINEAEVLRRQQLQIEQEIKQLEQQVVFFREIPNKPPPPYIPPANGSPLALIFPPESRINELIETRTKELFFDEPTAETLGSDHVTNIYEKLILDMCKELFTDVRPPSPDVSFRTVKHEKRPLAFHNPPDRLVCLQSYMKQKIKRILNEDSLLQQQQQQLNPHHCPMPFLMFAGSSAKRKRDQVDEILAQEMFDEEARWTNFDREEIEVKERIVAEVTKMLVGEAVRDMETAWQEKNADTQEESTLQGEKVDESN